MDGSLRSRSNPLLALLSLVVALTPAVAWAAWGTDPVTVHATTSYIGLVEACTDGAGGSLVIWREDYDPAGTGALRAQHLLANGDLDPTWPADGVVAHVFATTPDDMGMLPDRLGGFYLWWVRDLVIRLKRLDSTGQAASGWPAEGRVIGTTITERSSPSVIEDGAHGVYVAWSNGRAVALHIGPDNAPAAGWPADAQPLGVTGPLLSFTISPALALAPDGGVFAAWGCVSFDTTVAPSEYSVHRLTSAGAVASGWTPAGVSLGYCPLEVLSSVSWGTPTLGIAPDGRGGVFVATGESVNGVDLDPMWARLYRLQPDGQPAADWPTGGRIAYDGSDASYANCGPDCAVRVWSDGLDGAFTGICVHFVDGPLEYLYERLDATGAHLAGWCSYASGSEAAPRPGGGVYFADFWPTSHMYSAYEPDASIALMAVPEPSPSWTGVSEHHSGSHLSCYGDIGLTATDDGGCVFFWSQTYERFGLFARGFTSQGEVTGIVPALPSRLALHGLRFVPGGGIRASLALPDAGPGRLDVYDVMGRRSATESFAAAPGTVERTVAGTANLPAGVYFARVSVGNQSAVGRVVVCR